MTTTTTEFCESLVSNYPELKELLAEHISDYDELLPNVFLGEITRYVLKDGKGRCQIVEYLNKSLSSGEPDVKNLIAVSFVENLENREELERAVEGVETAEIISEWDRQKST
ncbi:hypothetical protein [uncultured Gimesia sp.]|uniref:DUF7674 family protein n=1 Tax=uncultured Gimesia sp. TaxID=1678688 RepID=UPI00262C1ACF|nr:hypothetical protein [uncultured Gimesia sp.]